MFAFHGFGEGLELLTHLALDSLDVLEHLGRASICGRSCRTRRNPRRSRLTAILLVHVTHVLHTSACPRDIGSASSPANCEGLVAPADRIGAGDPRGGTLHRDGKSVHHATTSNGGRSSPTPYSAHVVALSPSVT
jgi:hypothetical protein